jgi:hypothetical protein
MDAEITQDGHENLMWGMFEDEELKWNFHRSYLT